MRWRAFKKPVSCLVPVKKRKGFGEREKRSRLSRHRGGDQGKKGYGETIRKGKGRGEEGPGGRDGETWYLANKKGR